MRSSIFTSPTDFAGESIAAVLDNVTGRAGAGGVTIAANYHAARDIYPHNPRHKLHVTPGGVLFVEPAAVARTAIGAACPVDEAVKLGCSFAEVVGAARAAGIGASGWVNLCHLDNFSLPTETFCRNAFGDSDPASVCPANPEVIEFAAALMSDVSAASPDEIVIEAFHFNQVVHGYHHERWFISLSSLALYMLGLCLCDACRAGVDKAGGDPDRLADTIRRRTEDAIASDAAATGPPELAAVLETLGDTDGAALLEHRRRSVVALIDAVGAAAAVPLRLVDPAGAVRGYATGLASGAPGPFQHHFLGADTGQLGRSGKRIALLGYTSDAGRLRAELDAYAEAIGSLHGVEVVLRPSPPDCREPRELAAKVEACRSSGAGAVSFYHYGLSRLESLDWICAALG